MNLTASIALVISAAFNTTPAQIVALPAPMPTVQTVEEYVRDYFADEPILAEIAQCESHFKQFDNDGTVHRGVVNNLDVGIMQINEHYHSKTADKLDFDIYSIEGNLAYGKFLYDQSEKLYGDGTLPWKSSKSCWSKSQTYKAMKYAVAVNK